MEINRNKTNKKLQAVLDAQIGKGNINNVVVAVQSHDRNIDFVGAAGIADPKTGAVMTPGTPYFIASVTKMYTAAIVLRLHEEKRIDLNASISEYLPASLTRTIHVYKGTDYSDRIKVSNLIDQSSGLADYETDKPRGGKSILDELKAGHDRVLDTEEAIEIVRNLSPRFAPDTRGKAYYSNANYRLLGAIIESVTGKPMATNFKEMIFKPLGLQHTYLFDWMLPRSGEDPVMVYLKDAPMIVPKYLSSNVSDGGLVSTVSESLIFLRAFFEGQLFDKALFERMMNWNSIFFPLSYGYGLMRFRLPRFFWISLLPEFVGHSGSTGSFAFTCPSRSIYLAGTINQMASPSKPFFLMMGLVRAAS
jgi:CubicO group peptidase (beta-lactamase class C family)